MAKITRKSGDGKSKLRIAIEQMNDAKLEAGWFETNKYEDGTPVAYVAAIHEYGYAPGGIPPRSFMRPTIEERDKEWANLIAQGAKAVLAGRYTMRQVMEGLGGQVVGDVQAKIATIQQPPLKQSTILSRMRKYADGGKRGQSPTKPLVASGLMLDTMTWVVS